MLWALAVATTALAVPMDEDHQQERRLEKRIGVGTVLGLASGLGGLFGGGMSDQNRTFLERNASNIDGRQEEERGSDTASGAACVRCQYLF